MPKTMTDVKVKEEATKYLVYTGRDVVPNKNVYKLSRYNRATHKEDE